MSLKLLVEKQNMMAKFFKDTPWDINNIDQATADAMFSRLDSDMSPEALFMDGERPRAQAAKLAKQYRAAYKELTDRGYAPTIVLYNFES
jgi:hypothetical protein